MLFPVIFAGYIGMISFYTHVHTVNGVTIVHSHPFQKNTDGQPVHAHTSAEFRVIQALTSYSLTTEIVPHFQFLSFLFFMVPKTEEPLDSAFPAEDARGRGRRAPPFFF